MNSTTEFLAESNASYLAGKSIEAILSGDLKEAQELLKREEKRIEKLPKVPQVMEFPTAPIHTKIKVQDLPDNAKVCESCVKQDHRDDLPFDYKIVVHDKGKCDSCGVDTQLTNVLKVRSDIEAQKEPQKTTWAVAPKLE
jgi:hypothetical protein